MNHPLLSELLSEIDIALLKRCYSMELIEDKETIGFTLSFVRSLLFSSLL